MIGSQVARLSVAAGFKVMIGNSRGPETLQPLVAALGAQARAVMADEAVAEGDIVVLAVPFGIYGQLGPEKYAGRIVIDTMNYYPERDGLMDTVQTDRIAASQLVQKHLESSRLVKAMNNMDFVRLLRSARAAGDSERSAIPLASDDDEAKATVADFIARIGYDTVDMGTLEGSWRSEPTMPVYVEPYISPLDKSLPAEAIRDWFLNAPGRTVDAREVKDLLGRAVRHDKMFGSLSRTPGASL
jgi:predicted dinucleotide-binding enzyme